MELLGQIWGFLTLGIDNPMLAPVVGTLLSLIAGTVLGKAVVLLVLLLLYVVKALKDGQIDDTEAVILFWRLLSVVFGFLPNVNTKSVIKYAPPHWHDLIKTGNSPDFRLLPIAGGAPVDEEI